MVYTMQYFISLAVMVALAWSSWTGLTAAEPAVRWRDGQYQTADGKPVALRGVNLGSWLLLEPWMLRIEGIPDQEHLMGQLTGKFGAPWAADFRRRFEAAWLRAEDLAVVKAAGLNTVRIPFDSRPLIAEQGPLTVRPEGFAGLDAAIALAEQAGLFIILDLHGAPGGQNNDQSTGERGRNNLWSDPDAQQRTAAVWRAVAERYRDRPLVIAYDLINKPYGAGWKDVPATLQIMDLLVKTIRVVDPDRLIYIPGTSAGIRFYGKPQDRGWTTCGYTEHYYPGLYGQPETVATHQAFLARQVPLIAAEVAALGVPFLVGEFNPMLASAGAPVSTRAYFDAYNRLGWAATLWSLRWLKTEGGNGESDWCLITNRDPLPPIDAPTADAAAWERWLAVVAGPRSVNRGMVEAFAAEEASPFPAGNPPPLTKVPAGPGPDRWTGSDIGFASSGGEEVLADGNWRLVSAGHELFQNHDAFRFLHRPSPGSTFFSTVVIERLEAVHRLTKGGLMLRRSAGADAPFACVHAHPDGGVRFLKAAQAQGGAEESPIVKLTFPLELRLTAKAGAVTGSARSGDGPWTILGSMPWTWANGDHFGLALCAHDQRIPAEMITSPVRIAMP